MNLKEYFDEKKGKGVIATASRKGEVNAAVYAKPHVFDETTIGFIMRERLTHKNILENPYAHYLFIENEPHAKGVRLYLKKTMEERDTELIGTLKQRKLSPEEDEALGAKYLVFFEVEQVLPLIGSDETKLED